MKVPVLQVMALGEFSSWGRQFLGSLQEQELIVAHHAPSVVDYCKAMVPAARPAVVFVENHPESRKGILTLRQSGKPIYIVWLGRSFSKEDLGFAIENRVYCIFENMRSDEKIVVEKLNRLSIATESDHHFEQLIRAMKSIMLQAETDDKDLPVLQEIKAALTKLEQQGLRNEFNSASEVHHASGGSSVPFHKTQGFGDALSTVHDLERTGVLWLKGAQPQQEGKIEFLQGKIVSAVAGDTHGLKAIYRMFLWDTPRFLFHRKDPNDAVVEDYLDVSMTSLVKQGEALRARYERIRRELPPDSLTLEVDPHALHGDTSMPFSDFSTLATIVEFGKIANILDFNPLPDVDIYESMIRLRRGKIIRVATS